MITARGCLPLAAMDVSGRIDGLLAQVTVRQTFVNATDEPLEATYIFPLPDRGAVTGFRMEVAGRVVEGLLQERSQARQQYAQAIRQGHRASIAEEERPSVFTIRVGNLMPGDVATVELSLVGALPYSDGEVTFRFPMVVAPRYIPGVPLSGLSVGDGTAVDTTAVPDASRITPPVLLPGFPSPVRLSMVIDLYDTGAAAMDEPARQPARGLGGGHSRSPADYPPARRPARSGFHPPVPPRWPRGPDVALASSRRRRCRGDVRTDRCTAGPVRKQPTRKNQGRGTSSSCSIAPAACPAGRWWPHAGRRPA